MPLAKLKTTQFEEAMPPRTPPAPAGTDHFVGTPSPARLLQQRLEYTGAPAAAADLARWSPRRSLALILASSVGLWAAIIMATRVVVHAVA